MDRKQWWTLSAAFLIILYYSTIFMDVISSAQKELVTSHLMLFDKTTVEANILAGQTIIFGGFGAMALFFTISSAILSIAFFIAGYFEKSSKKEEGKKK